MQSCRLLRSYSAWSRRQRRSSPAACARCCAPDAGLEERGGEGTALACLLSLSSSMLRNVHMLPGPAVDIAVHHDLVLAVAGHSLHPGLEHAEKYPPDHGHIAHILLQNFLGLPVDLETLLHIEFGASLFQQGIELGVGPGLAPAAG